MHLSISSIHDLEQASRSENLQFVTELTMHNLGLTVIPEWIFELPYIRKLVVSNNALTAISGSIEKFAETLTTLYINDNIIATLPPQLGRLKKLKSLNVSNNNLAPGGIPPSIGDCVFLEDIDCSLNSTLGELPATLSSLRQLVALSANKCSLASLPYQMRANTSLERLNLASNNIATLPPCIPYMTSLYTLSLVGNPIPAAEKEIIKSALKSIKQLYL